MNDDTIGFGEGIDLKEKTLKSFFLGKILQFYTPLNVPKEMFSILIDSSLKRAESKSECALRRILLYFQPALSTHLSHKTRNRLSGI